MLHVKIAGKDYASDKMTYPKSLQLEKSQDFAQKMQRSSLLVWTKVTSICNYLNHDVTYTCCSFLSWWVTGIFINDTYR
ncbi:hypothetical protein PVAP13_6NG209512 [Panicum virgatum]|uniref:Uncharacterized protein n=1 Tax=Panicum virgatum TaxID=38727 RepID=A0A8T0R152_PANVG|nr:hypothetical protein PVAP13_6NG209512 [Panicum virgatum]